MGHTVFDIATPNYEDFFNTQIGSGSYFEGLKWQRGRGQVGQGTGKFLKNIWRFLQPSLKSAGKALGREGLNTGVRVLSSVARGDKVEDAVIKEAKEGARHLLEKANDKFAMQKQKGSGAKRRKLIGRRFTKKPRYDALGPY